MNKNKFYNQLKELGFTFDVAIDCGAAVGEWSSMFKHYFPESFLIAVDANDWCKGSFPNANISEIAVLSYKDDDEVIFYRKKENIESGSFCTGDSIFRENSQHYQSNNTIESKERTKTLKSILNKSNIKKVDVLKIDTQGSELLIMKGLGEILKEVKFIELECSLIDYNKGGCNFSDLVSFLKEDFDLYDIVNTHRINSPSFDINKQQRSGDFLFQIDIIFKNKKVEI